MTTNINNDYFFKERTQRNKVWTIANYPLHEADLPAFIIEAANEIKLSSKDKKAAVRNSYLKAEPEKTGSAVRKGNKRHTPKKKRKANKVLVSVNFGKDEFDFKSGKYLLTNNAKVYKLNSKYIEVNLYAKLFSSDKKKPLLIDTRKQKFRIRFTNNAKSQDLNQIRQYIYSDEYLPFAFKELNKSITYSVPNLGENNLKMPVSIKKNIRTIRNIPLDVNGEKMKFYAKILATYERLPVSMQIPIVKEYAAIKVKIYNKKDNSLEKILNVSHNHKEIIRSALLSSNEEYTTEMLQKVNFEAIDDNMWKINRNMIDALKNKYTNKENTN